MNIKNFTAILEKLIRTQMPYGYDNTEQLLIGVNIDGKIYDISDVQIVPGGILINPISYISQKQQVPSLLQPQKKNKKEETTEKKETP